MANGYRREPNWYLADGTYNRLSRAAIVTLAHLTRCMDGKGWTGCLSTSRLIELTGLGKSSVARAIVELKEAGILERENGEHRYSIRPDPRPTGGTDCPTDGTTCAPPVGHERPTGGTSAPHGWDSHPYSSKTLTKNDYQEGESSPFVESHLEVDEREANRAAKLLCDQTDANGKPIWRYGTNEARRLGRVWVMENHRDPDDLPALVAYGLGKAKGNAAAYIARIIEGGNWEPEAEPVMDAERREKLERLRRHREERKAAAK